MPSVELLSRAGESFVVTDPKGEIYERSAANVAARGYQIYCLNLRDFQKGNTWNPLMLPYDYYQKGEKSKAVEMVSEFVRFLVGEEGTDLFWNNTAMDVITGLILILLECADRTECHMKSVLYLWECYLAEKREWITSIQKKHGNSMIKRKLASLDNDSERTVGSIEAFVTRSLNRIIANEEFVSFLSQEGMGFEKVTKNKTAIYLIIPDENKFYHFLTSVFMEQLYEVLIKEAQKQPQNKLKIRMNYIIDEFANIPKMQNMDSMITAARSRNIRFNLIVQSKMQLEEKYGEIASVICDNCNNWIYLYSKDYGLLNEISKLCGEVIYDNHMTIPLISEFDLQHLSKEEGEALVLAGRNYPCIVNLADIEEYPTLQIDEKEHQLYCEQKWSSVPVFTFEKQKPSAHYSYIPRENEYLEYLDFLDSNEDRLDTWLIGTCNGMILLEELVTRKEAKNGTAALRMCMELTDKIEDIIQLKWYTAPRLIFRNYARKRFNSPEKVFFTIDEIGEDLFVPLHNEILDKIGRMNLC